MAGDSRSMLLVNVSLDLKHEILQLIFIVKVNVRREGGYKRAEVPIKKRFNNPAAVVCVRDIVNKSFRGRNK